MLLLIFVVLSVILLLNNATSGNQIIIASDSENLTIEASSDSRIHSYLSEKQAFSADGVEIYNFETNQKETKVIENFTLYIVDQPQKWGVIEDVVHERLQPVSSISYTLEDNSMIVKLYLSREYLVSLNEIERNKKTEIIILQSLNKIFSSLITVRDTQSAQEFIKNIAEEINNGRTTISVNLR